MDSNEEAYLTYDLITEILSWLPPKTLIYLRSVCKLMWFSTISNPKFIQNHQSHFGNSPLNDNDASRTVIQQMSRDWPLTVGLLPDSNTTPGKFLDSKALMNRYVVCEDMIQIFYGSCNGILCCTEISNLGYHRSVFVYNPCIRRVIPLPSCPSVHVASDHYLTSSNGVLCYGIGFDSVSNDYKVVMMRSSTHYAQGKAVIFSLNSNSKKTVQGPIPILTAAGDSIFLHGFIHWVICGAQWKKDISMMVFDIWNEVFGELQLPTSGTNGLSHTDKLPISVVEGSLWLLVSNLPRDHLLSLQVWRMNEYGVVESWAKLFRVELQDCYPAVGLGPVASLGGKIMVGRVAARSDADADACPVPEDEEDVSVGGRSFELILYDPETLQFSSVCKLRNYPRIFYLEATLGLLNYEASNYGF